MKVIFETERLRFREFTLSDAVFIIELLNSPGWIQFIGDRNVNAIDDAKKYLVNGPFKSYRDFRYGLSMVELKTDGTPIGMSGILNRTTLDTPDLGFAFLPGFEGKGYGFEIANAIIKYARAELNINTLAAITKPDNSKSIKLLEKLGFNFVSATFDSVTAEELLLYRNEVH